MPRSYTQCVCGSILLLLIASLVLSKKSNDEDVAIELIAEAVVEAAFAKSTHKTKANHGSKLVAPKYALAIANSTDILADAATDNNGCFKLGTYQQCEFRAGQFTFHNNGGPLNQVLIFNKASHSFLVSLVRVLRTPDANWQEAGLAICDSTTGEGCSNNPPGQTKPGLGEIHSFSALPNAAEFLPAAEFKQAFLEIKPGHVRIRN